MTSKIKIKVGSIEIECEGSEEFLKNEMIVILKAAAALQGEDPEGEGDHAKKDIGKVSKGTTSTFASKLGCKKGGDLVVAAAAKLNFIDNKDSFSRPDLLAEMQSAKTFYKKTYSNNMTETLKALVRAKRLNELSEGQFSLTESEIESLKGVLS